MKRKAIFLRTAFFLIFLWGISGNVFSQVDAGPDQTICNSFATLEANNPSPDIGTWTILEGNVVFTDINNPNTQITKVKPGINKLVWTVVIATVPQHDTVVITNNSPTPANAGIDITVCDDYVTLEGNNPAIGTGVWSKVNGSGTIIYPNNPNSPVVNLSHGANTFTWTTKHEGCENTDNIVITNNSVFANAGSSQELCETTAYLQAEYQGAGNDGMWSIVSGTGNFVDAANSNTQVNDIEKGVNIYKWSVSNISCEDESIVEIINNTPHPINAGDDMVICNSMVKLNASPPIEGQGMWIIPSEVQIVSPTMHNTNVYGLKDETQYTFTWEVKKGNCTASDEVIVTNNSFKTYAGADKTICQNYLQANAQSPQPGQGYWSIISGYGTANTPSMYNTIVTNIAQGENIFRWNVSKNGCNAYDDVTIINNTPSPAMVGDARSVCNGDELTLVALEPNIGQGLWTVLSGYALIENPSNHISQAYNLAKGNNDFKWSITNIDCVSEAVLNIHNKDFKAEAGINQIICSGETNLNANLPINGSGNWTIISGQGVIEDPTAAETMVSNLAKGVNAFQWNVTDGECEAIDAVIITNNMPTNANAGIDQNISGTTATLQANAPQGNEVGQWKLIAGDGFIQDPNSHSTPVTNLGSGENIFEWEITHNSCASRDMVSISTDIAGANAGNDQFICETQTTLNANAPTPNTGTWVLVSGNAVFENPNNPTTNVSELSQGKNVLVWKITEEGNTNLLYSDTVVITNNQTTIANAGIDKITCSNTYQLDANEPTIGYGVWNISVGKGVFDDMTHQKTTVRNIGFGVNSYLWKIRKGECFSEDEVQITNNMIMANAGGYQEICSDNADLYANNPTPGTGLWTQVLEGNENPAVISVPNQNSTSVHSLKDGISLFVWTINNEGCKTTDTVVINNKKPYTFAGSDDTVCTPNINLMAKNLETGQFGKWSILDGYGVIHNINNPKSQVSDLSFGVNIFKWEIIENGCINSDTVKITSNAPYANAGENIEICVDTIFLTAVQPPANSTGIWTSTNTSVSIINPNSHTTKVKNLTFGINKFAWTVTNELNCTISDTVIITSNKLIANAGSDQIDLCNPEVTLNAQPAPPLANGMWSIISGEAKIDNPNLPNSIVRDIKLGNTTLKWTLNYKGCTFEDDVFISNNYIPSNAGVNKSICENFVKLEGNQSEPGSGAWTTTNPEIVIENSNSNITFAHNLPKGLTTFQWAITNSGCFSDAEIKITNNSPTKANAGVSQTIPDNTANLMANSTNVGETGHWSVIRGTGIFANPNLNSTQVNNVGSGENVYRWTISNGECESWSNLSITSLDMGSNAGQDKHICKDSILLIGNDPSIMGNGQGIGTWTAIDGGTATILNPNSYITKVHNLQFGINKFEWKIVNGITLRDTVFIYNDSPTPAMAGADAPVCKPHTQLMASIPGTGTGMWSSPSSVSFSNPTSYNSDVLNLKFGENVLKWTVENGECISEDEVVITYNGFEIQLAKEKEVCRNSVLLKVATNPNVSGIWTSLGATSVNIVNPEALITNATDLETGINKFIWTGTKESCNISDTISIINSKPSEAIFNGEDIFCGQNGTLEATTPSIGQGSWYPIASDAIIQVPTMANTQVTNLQKGANKFVWKITNSKCVDSTIVTIYNKGTYAFAGKNTTTCYDKVLLNANTPQFGTGSWQAESAVAGFFENTSSPITVLNDIPRGSSNYIWTVTNEYCSSSDTVQITNNQPSEAFAGENQAICGDSTTLNATTPDVGQGMWELISGYGVIANPTQTNTEITKLPYGKHTLMWYTSNFGCRDSATIDIINNSIPAHAGNDITVCSYYNLHLYASSPHSGVGSWSVIEGQATFENSTSNTTKVSNLIPNYPNIFRWTILNEGCSSFDDVTVTYNSTTKKLAKEDQEVCDSFATLSANAIIQGIGEWTIMSGGGIIENPTSNISQVTNLSPGINSFTWTVQNGDCIGSNHFSIFYNKLTAQTAPDRSICRNYVKLVGNKPLIGGLGQWAIASGEGNILGVSSDTALVRNLSIGENKFTWTISKSLCKAVDTLTITNNTVRAGFNFTANGNEIAFNPITTGNIAKYYWEFGDGNFSEIANPTHTYTSNDVYPVLFAVYNPETKCRHHIKKPVEIGTNLVQAMFNYTTIGNKITLNNQSVGNIGETYWTFGDGAYSTTNNAIHTYNQAGVYTVCLKITDATSGHISEICKDIEVGIGGCNLSADFSFFVQPQEKKVAFIDESVSDTITNWFWDFGDGKTSTEQEPTHQYENPGIYLVSLGVRDNINNCIDYKAKIVQIGTIDCQAAFKEKINPQTLEVEFKNKSIGTNVFFWNFGDDNYSTQENPTHQYNHAGQYTVTLAVAKADGSCMDYKIKRIQVGEIACSANFKVFVDSTNNTAMFRNKIMGASTLLYWDFGDGAVSVQPNPIHQYQAPGYYHVSLNTYNSETGCMDMHQEVVLIGQSGQDCEAKFIHRADFATRTVKFFDKSLGTGLTYIWDFGDGQTSTEQNPIYTFTKGNFAHVCLTVTNSNGISNTFCKRIRIAKENTNNCLAEFIYSVDSINNTVSFLDKSLGEPNEWAWEFGDGSYSTDQNPTHEYTNTGYYKVRLKIRNAESNCKSKYIDIVNVSAGDNGIHGGFDYTIDTTSNTKEGYPTDFVGAAFGTAAKVSWNFGDSKGTNTTSLTPTYVYPEIGVYNVCFTVSDPITEQSNTTCDEVDLNVLANEDFKQGVLSLNSYPNPILKTSKIVYNLPLNEKVRIEITDTKGNLVKVLVNTTKQSGPHDIILNANEFADGLYYIRLITSKGVITEKIVISK